MIDDKPLIVTDKRKIKEIKEALKSSKGSFTNVKAAKPDKLPKNAKEIWFSQNKAQKKK